MKPTTTSTTKTAEPPPVRTGRRGRGFTVGRGSMGCSIATNERCEGYGRPIRHYGFRFISVNNRDGGSAFLSLKMDFVLRTTM
jgi:hypothetical protein